jgi:hypothetical protein
VAHPRARGCGPGLDADYDRIQELANQHATLRLMLSHGGWAGDAYCELQTLKDNLTLFTPEILDRINREVVRAGHQALKKSPEEGLNARADSFVVETNVEYPTDTGLHRPALRCRPQGPRGCAPSCPPRTGCPAGGRRRGGEAEARAVPKSGLTQGQNGIAGRAVRDSCAQKSTQPRATLDNVPQQEVFPANHPEQNKNEARVRVYFFKKQGFLSGTK